MAGAGSTSQQTYYDFFIKSEVENEAGELAGVYCGEVRVEEGGGFLTGLGKSEVEYM